MFAAMTNLIFYPVRWQHPYRKDRELHILALMHSWLYSCDPCCSKNDKPKLTNLPHSRTHACTHARIHTRTHAWTRTCTFPSFSTSLHGYRLRSLFLHPLRQTLSHFVEFVCLWQPNWLPCQTVQLFADASGLARLVSMTISAINICERCRSWDRCSGGRWCHGGFSLGYWFLRPHPCVKNVLTGKISVAGRWDCYCKTWLLVYIIPGSLSLYQPLDIPVLGWDRFS